MKNLFTLGLEEQGDKDDVDPNVDTSDLLVNKLIKYAQTKKKTDGISVTADVIKERDKLKTDLKEELKKDSSESSDSSDNKDKSSDKSSDESSDNDNDNKDSENNDSNDSNDSKEENNDDDNKEDSKDDEASNDSKDEEKKDSGKNDEDEESDLTKAADDSSSLSNIIGSGTKKSSDKSSESKEKKDEGDSDDKALSFNSYQEKITNIHKALKPIYVAYESYRDYTSKKLGLRPISLEEMPVAYTKEDLTKAVNNLIELCGSFSKNNTQIVNKRKQGISTINKTSAIISEAYKNDKLQLVFKVVTDRDLIFTLAIDTDTDITKSVRVMLKYLNDADNLTKSLLSNPMAQYDTMVKSCGFEYSKEDGSYIYKEILPSYTEVHLSQYEEKKFQEVDIKKVSCYKVVISKQNTIAALEPVQITKDNQLSTLIKGVDQMVIDCSVYLDNQLTVSKTFDEMADKLKTLLYDIEKEVVKNYADLNIEKTIDEITRLKLVSDFTAMNVDISIGFMTSLITLLGLITEIK